ncbi:MAG: hypothetical protein ABUS51_10365 [Acidobacteriota bacterium]
MLRGLILLFLIAGIAFLAAPFLLSSLALDEHGITIPGQVFSKSETVKLHNSAWTRSSEVTFRYEPPDDSGVAFFGLSLTPGQYDRLHAGDAVHLRYLRRRDVPVVPLSGILLQVHALPVVRLADRGTFTGFRELFTPGVMAALGALTGLAALLLFLRRTASRLFGWVLGISLVSGFTLVMLYDFPRPTPPPVLAVRQTVGRVKSLDRIDRIFEGKRSRGSPADQPVDVVGIEFIPAGRTESVTAVDLIDAGSVSGLKVDSTVAIRYEADSPRTAHIQAATRGFVSRNVGGLALQGALCLAIVIACFAIPQAIGRLFRRLASRRHNS